MRCCVFQPNKRRRRAVRAARNSPRLIRGLSRSAPINNGGIGGLALLSAQPQQQRGRAAQSALLQELQQQPLCFRQRRAQIRYMAVTRAPAEGIVAPAPILVRPRQ